MISHKKAVIFTPFWSQVGNVGTNRIDRFLRWLVEEDYGVTIVRAGTSFLDEEKPWGREITIGDPLGIYRDLQPGVSSMAPHRKPNKLRRAAAYWLFYPDPAIVWSRAASRHPVVQSAVRECDFILSSNPPEAGHMGACALARRYNVPHLVDMRDGWLDEPLRPLLRGSMLRRRLEGVQESKVLKPAAQILVTSNKWKELLCARYPDLAPKVHVLANGYPQRLADAVVPPAGRDRERVLVHAGQFSGSDGRRTPALLLEPLLKELESSSERGVVKLVGPMINEELSVVDSLRSRFLEIGWRIECTGRIPRDDLLNELPKADGLLMLSTSFAGLPAKLFEYIPTGRPLFVVSQKGSAAWQLCEQLPQAALTEPAATREEARAAGPKAFYLKQGFSVPSEYGEPALKEKFRRVVDSVVGHV